MRPKASAATCVLLTQGGNGLLLGPLRRKAHLTVRHRHGTDLEPLGCGPQRQALQEREPQSSGLGGGQLIHGCERRPAQYTGRNLHDSTAVEPVIAAADMVFLSVNTPTKARGIGAGQASDLRWIEAALR